MTSFAYFLAKTIVGRTGAVVNVADSDPRVPWFETQFVVALSKSRLPTA